MGRTGARLLVLVLASVLIPACGGGGGGGTGAAPTVIVLTPAGMQSSKISISFTLVDPESNPVTITVEFSTDGGGTYAPATAAYANPGTAGLASSPGGTAHTFLWNSMRNGVATGAVNTQVRIRITPSDGTAGPPDGTTDFTVDNTFERVIGVTTAVYPHALATLASAETELGSLVADGVRIQFGMQLCLQNALSMRAPLPSSFLPADTSLRRPDAGYAAGPPYDLVMGDIDLLLPFGNSVAIRTVTGSQVWAMLEHGVAQYPTPFAGFPHISGFSFTFKESDPPYSRVISVTLDGGAPILNDSTTYTFATSSFLNNGGDGYSMLNDGQGEYYGNQAQAVADYIESLGTITPVIPGRMTIVP